MKNKVIILDVETATLPITKDIARNQSEIKLLNIARPLIYDIGWVILNTKTKKIESKKNFLVEEIFFTPVIFNTAYYRDKRPQYIKMLKEGKIKRLKWDKIINELINDLDKVDYSLAYNAMFDFKKAIPFTEEYFDMLNSEGYQEWEDKQRFICRSIISKNKKRKKSDKDFDQYNFTVRDKNYPMKDIWGLSCRLLINKDSYKMFCLNNSMISESGLFFKTTAECVYRYLEKKYSFIEAHTALDDAVIESKIFIKCLNYKLEDGIIYFPFRDLGETVDFIESKSIKSNKIISMLKIIMYEKIDNYSFSSPFSNLLQNRILRLEKIKQTKSTSIDFIKLKKRMLLKEIRNIYNKLSSLDESADMYYNYYMIVEDKLSDLEELNHILQKEEQKKKHLFIYYHNYDFDGKFSGSIVDNYFDKNYKREWIGYNYDSVLDFSHISNKDYVYVVDLSFEGETLQNFIELSNRNKNVVWCDHHPASIESECNIKGYRSDCMAGCGLTYLYMNKIKLNEKSFELLPKEIQLVSDSDTFSRLFNETNNFICGLLGEETNPEYLNNIWTKFISKETNYKFYLSQGSHINKFRVKQGEEICSSFGYELIFNGVKTFCINSHRLSVSSVRGKYDLVIMWFYMGDGRYKYSLRSNDNVDCRKIAESYGGGGHGNAASFILDKMIL